MIKIKNIIILIITVTLIGYCIYYFVGRESKTVKLTKKLLYNTSEKFAEIDKYIVYGTHLNIEGKIDEKIYEDNIISAELVFKSVEDKMQSFEIEYEMSNDDKFTFYTSENINDGINLDNLKNGNYYVFIKIKQKNLNTNTDDEEIVTYYSLKNKTKYNNIEYYTITKQHKNNKIDIAFDNLVVDDLKKYYMNIKIEETKLPENVYDIVIDPGHGGKDGGAVTKYNGKEYAEKDITLDYAKDLKKSLEKLGLKIKLTRDGNNEEELGIYDMYGKGGRAVIPNEVKAKYTLSLHLNSAEYKMNKGGIEIYAPSNARLEFAKLLSDNIVEYAKTNYSPNVTARVYDGVYVRNFSYYEIQSSANSAKESGYEPYNITADTPYLFMVREPGGLATNAYVDGRNKLYGKNPYYNSNIGVESYLLELGFMNSTSDFENVLNNKKLYIEGIKETFKNYLDL